MDKIVCEDLDAAMDELRDAKLIPYEASAYASMISSARHASNGCPDKIEAITSLLGRQTAVMVRDRIGQPERFAEAVRLALASHESICPLRSGTMSAKMQNVSGWMQAVRPLRWPVALVVLWLITMVAISGRIPEAIAASERIASERLEKAKSVVVTNYYDVVDVVNQSKID